MKKSLLLVSLFLFAGCSYGASSKVSTQPVVPPSVPVANAPVSQPAENSFVSASSAGYLVGPKGMTLYTYTKDTPGVSTCYDKCAVNWPILEPQGTVTSSGTTGTFNVITRTDGKSQVTYNDLPLYYWINDQKPGDITGNGVGGVWLLAKP